MAKVAIPLSLRWGVKLWHALGLMCLGMSIVAPAFTIGVLFISVLAWKDGVHPGFPSVELTPFNVVLTVLLGGLGYQGGKWGHLLLLALRDVSLTRIARLRAWSDERPGFFILRSFFLKKFQYSPPVSYPSPLGTPRWLVVHSILQDVEVAVLHFGWPIFLRTPSYPHPATRSHSIVVYTDDADWKHRFRVIAAGCRAILMLPEASKGVVEEIQEIQRSGWIDKTLFFMSPLLRTGSDDESVESRAEDWSNVARTAAECGLHFPSYKPEGGFFLLDTHGHTRAEFPLPAAERLDESIRLAMESALTLLPVRDVLPAHMLLVVLELMDKPGFEGFLNRL